MSVKSVVLAAAVLVVLMGLPLFRTWFRRGEKSALSAICGLPLQSTPETSREAESIMARRRYEYAAVKVMPDQNPVPELNRFGAEGYRVVATAGQLLILGRNVKEHDEDEEEEED